MTANCLAKTSSFNISLPTFCNSIRLFKTFISSTPKLRVDFVPLVLPALSVPKSVKPVDKSLLSPEVVGPNPGIFSIIYPILLKILNPVDNALKACSIFIFANT